VTPCSLVIFWYIKSCSPLKVNARFGGICRFRLQGLYINQERNQLSVALEVTWSTETSVDLIGVCGFISQKIEFFITTGVRTSNPTESGRSLLTFRTNVLPTFPTLKMEAVDSFETSMLTYQTACYRKQEGHSMNLVCCEYFQF
jgi:hypothetical protein